MLKPIALLTTVSAALLLSPSGSLADTSQSSNWAGYAIHRSGVRFTRVVASWKQPGASCAAGHQTYSAVWVGLGGFSLTSNALEQVGTEVDCTASGRISSSAWYELVPAASQPIGLKVKPGDTVAASVTVVAHQMTVGLYDVTTHRWFQKTLHGQTIDVSSAEWILEAPSDCISENACQTLPLANFGSTTFALAQAQSTSGHLGTISDPAWDWTKIRLTPGGRRFVVYSHSGPTAGVATPSPLNASGSSFKVIFARVSVQRNPFLSQRLAAPRAGYLVHAGR